MSQEIAPCPFCKAENAETDKVNMEAFAVWCSGCGAMGPLALSEEDAIVRWNGRS